MQKDWSLFIAQLVEPEVREWIEADDQRYEAFGLTNADQPIKLIIRLTREGRSVDRSMVVGRQGPDATYYAGSEVETGPVVCKVSLDLVEILLPGMHGGLRRHRPKNPAPGRQRLS